jgi:gamma-glutamyltranspeptidase/glutathione hydrolase
LTKAYWQSKSKGYKINETDKEIVGQVDAILVLPNGKLEGGPMRGQ